MKIGIIGLGVVGSVNKKGFLQAGHDVIVHDIKMKTIVDDVVKTDIVFICVPTPSTKDGSCDTSIVESVIKELLDKKYDGVIAIRSTVIPGFTVAMQEKFFYDKICFVPEFVRERCVDYDFLLEHRLLAVGTYDNKVYNLVKHAHGNLPKNTVMLKPHEAELLKYYTNLLAVTRITFANIFFEVCKKFDADYKKIKDAFVHMNRLGDMYLDVNEDLRGYGGVCLPKDTKAFIKLLEDMDLDLNFFKSIDEDNSKFPTTVFDMMRKADKNNFMDNES